MPRKLFRRRKRLKKSSLRKPRAIASFRHRGQRRCIVDSGASFHLVAENSLAAKERATIVDMDEAIPITTTNGEVEVTQQCQVYVQELGFFVRSYILDCSVAVLSLGVLCDEHGFTYSWRPRQPPYLVKEFKVTCYPSHNVPIIFSNIHADKEEDGETTSDRDVPTLDDDSGETDPEMPNLADSSSDEEGGTTVNRDKKKKSKQDSSSSFSSSRRRG